MKALQSALNPQTRKATKSKKKGASPAISEVATFECALTQEGETPELAPSLTLAQGIIADLNDRSGPGSRRAVARLAALATEAILELERLSSSGNRHIQDVARWRIDWPVLTARHHAILEKNATWIESIGLGTNADTRILLAQLPARQTPARRCTLHLMKLVAHIQHAGVWGESIHEDLTLCDESFLRVLRSWLKQDYTPTMFKKVKLTWPLVLRIKKLPPLGPEATTIGAWQDVTLELLALNCDEDPSSIPELCALGEHRRYHPYPAEVARKLGDDLKMPLEQQWNNIWRKIKEILKEEIRKICGHVQKLRTPKV